MNWQCLKFSDLTVDQLYDLLKLRVDIFVIEQACIYPDLDDHDRHPMAHHLLGYEGQELQVYMRLLPPGSTYPCVSFGRVATRKQARGRGLGQALVKQGLIEIERIWPEQPVKIGAQLYLFDFYKNLGFNKISEEYLEDGIPHVDMLLAKHEVA